MASPAWKRSVSSREPPEEIRRLVEARASGKGPDARPGRFSHRRRARGPRGRPGARWERAYRTGSFSTPETITDVDDAGVALDLSQLSIALNNGHWCARCHTRAVVVYGYLDRASRAYQLKVWSWYGFEDGTGTWSDISDRVVDLAPSLGASIKVPVIAYEVNSGTKRMAIAGLVEAADGSNSHIAYASFVMDIYGTLDDPVEATLGTVLVSNPQDVSLCFTADGYAALTWIGTPADDPDAPAQVAVAWEVVRETGLFDGELVFESTTESGDQPTIAAGDSEIVVVWTAESGEAPDVVRALRSISLPREERTLELASPWGTMTIPYLYVDTAAATLTDADTTGGWDGSLVWVESQSYVLGFQAEVDGRYFPYTCETDDGGVTWSAASEIPGSTNRYNYYVSLSVARFSTGAQAVAATWEGSDYDRERATETLAEVAIAEWTGAPLEFSRASNVGPVPQTDRDFAVFPCCTIYVPDFWWTVFVGHNGDRTSGGATDVELRGSWMVT